ncbi:CAP domain-containing protein [Streptomyces vilmorinianum]|uniref:CAP domain-containing protein n=1 Tax=Streptomyces vilmorinianum TaxID=3051092 RepID=UPI001586E901|nr:CAP domain-containing protein [Streptomyces vilmorinianum]
MQHDDERSPDDQRMNGGGRHRRGGGGTRRQSRRIPSFRTAVTLAGAATAVLTVAAGTYAALGTATPGTDTRSDAVALTNVAPHAEGAAPMPAPSASDAPAVPPRATPTAPSVPSSVTAAPSAAPSAPRSVGASQAPSAPSSPAASARPVPAQQKAVPPAAGTSTSGKAAQYIDRVVALANAERAKAGCAPLRSDGRLRTSAQAHADDMARRDYYEHNSPEGRDAGDRIRAAGYAWFTWAENIHRGPKSPAEAMEDWMKSDGHRRNILNCSFKDIGVGVTLTANGPWWVQNFGVRR